ncbi:MAG: SRPBCC family protein [Rhizonema sp. NSF051]|nr:SRPBCC family protein [Rhizonema sp. NSF051]
MIEEHSIQEELDLLTAPHNSTDLEPNSEDAVALQSVQVQVKKIAERQRQITARIQIPQSIEQVWKVLTDYEALVKFIPNLAKSRLVKHPTGGIRLEQIGSQRLLRFNFCARVVLDLKEYFPKEISFCLVEGDFKDFSGSWSLESCPLGEQMGTNLYYTLKVWPKLTMPVGIIENRLSKDLQLNLVAIRARVLQLASN